MPPVVLPAPVVLPPRPRASAPVRAEEPAEEFAPPAPELLHRVLDGLRRLS